MMDTIAYILTSLIMLAGGIALTLAAIMFIIFGLQTLYKDLFEDEK